MQFQRHLETNRNNDSGETGLAATKMELNKQEPAQQVFATRELLEAILLHLDIGDLLPSAQRVSKRWNALIRTSSVLRKRLFLPPLPQDYLEGRMPSFPDSPDTPRLGPLEPINRLKSLLQEWFDGHETDDSHDKVRLYTTAAICNTEFRDMNPVISRFHHELHYYLEYRQGRCARFFSPDSDAVWHGFHTTALPREAVSVVHSYEDIMDDSRVVRRAAFLYPGASWRRMLVAAHGEATLTFMASELVVGATAIPTLAFLQGITAVGIEGRSGGEQESGGVTLGMLYDLMTLAFLD